MAAVDLDCGFSQQHLRVGFWGDTTEPWTAGRRWQRAATQGSEQRGCPGSDQQQAGKSAVAFLKYSRKILSSYSEVV